MSATPASKRLRRLVALAFALSALAEGPRPLAGQVRDASVLAATGTSGLAGVVLDDATDSPVVRAIVTVSGAAPPYRSIASTDAGGKFVFTDLPAGDVTVTVAKTAYLTTYVGSSRPGRGPAVPFALSGGPAADRTIRMVRGGVLSGMVVGSTGAPMSGVEMTALEWRTIDGERQLVEDARGEVGLTDDRGRYRLWGLLPGDYVVEATPPEVLPARAVTDADLQWASATIRSPSTPAGTPAPHPPAAGRTVQFAATYYPGVADAANATTVSLPPGAERAGIDVALLRVATASIGGMVITLDGQSLSGAQVHLAEGSLPEVHTRSDALGAFEFRTVPPGDVTLGVRAPNGDAWATADVSINGQDRNGITLALRPGMTVTGHVVFEGSTAPPAGAQELISLVVAGATRGIATQIDTRAAANGAFAVSGLAPARYHLQAAVVDNGAPPRGQPTESWRLAAAMLNGEDVLDGALAVTAGQDVSGLVLIFSNRETDLRGTLLDSSDRPVAGFGVVVFPADRRLWSASRRVRQTTLGADGGFDFAGLPAGDYRVAAVTRVEDGDLADTDWLEALAPLAVAVTLSQGEQKVQNLRLARKGPESQ